MTLNCAIAETNGRRFRLSLPYVAIPRVMPLYGVAFEARLHSRAKTTAAFD